MMTRCSHWPVSVPATSATSCARWSVDRIAAKDASPEFLDDKRYSRSQVEFVHLIIDCLSDAGVVEPRMFDASPFTDLSPQGPEVNRVFPQDRGTATSDRPSLAARPRTVRPGGCRVRRR